MDFKQTVIDKMLSGELNGCVQLDETFDVESDEGTSTAIFLDGVYQNCALSANAKTSTVKRCILKDGIKHNLRALNTNDIEFDADSDEMRTETVHGDVVILCCSMVILGFIKTLATKHESDS